MKLSTLSICISIAVAFAAIISPIIVTILNNRHQLKLKKLELEQQHFERTTMHKRELVENCLRATGAFLACQDVSTEKEYGNYYFKTLLYVGGDIRAWMENVNTYIDLGNYEAAATQLGKAIPEIEQFVQRL